MVVLICWFLDFLGGLSFWGWYIFLGSRADHPPTPKPTTSDTEVRSNSQEADLPTRLGT